MSRSLFFVGSSKEVDFVPLGEYKLEGKLVLAPAPPRRLEDWETVQ